MMFKMLGGNTLAPGPGVGSWGELSAVSVHHPCGKHFSMLIGTVVSVVSVVFKIGDIPLLDPLLYLPLSCLIFQNSQQESFISL